MQINLYCFCHTPPSLQVWLRKYSLYFCSFDKANKLTFDETNKANYSKRIKMDHNESQRIQMHQKASKGIKIHQNASKYIKLHQNTSKCIKIHQHASDVIKIQKNEPKYQNPNTRPKWAQSQLDRPKKTELYVRNFSKLNQNGVQRNLYKTIL